MTGKEPRGLEEEEESAAVSWFRHMWLFFFTLQPPCVGVCVLLLSRNIPWFYSVDTQYLLQGLHVHVNV